MSDTPEGYTEIKLLAKDECERCGGNGYVRVALLHGVLEVLAPHDATGFCECVVAVKVYKGE